MEKWGGEANEEVNSSVVTGRNGGDGTLRLEVARVDVVEVEEVGLDFGVC